LPRERILIIDDEPAVRFGMRDFLESSGYVVDEADSSELGLQRLRDGQPDVTILDYKLPDGTAVDLLPRLAPLDPGPIIILTAHGSIDLAVQAIKLGAEQFLTKPVELKALQLVIERLLGNRSRQRQSAKQAREAERHGPCFIGTSAAVRALAEQAKRVASSDAPVLIQGETGAGKGVLARWLHANGPRAHEAFVDLNTAGLSRDFLETELFGHEKGAFTGAVGQKPGLLEIAHHGTLFLDEIGDVDAAVQPKLLKVVEEQRFRRLGDVRDRQVDVRLITATHQDLARLCQEKRFRSDLYFRINTLTIRVPPLRERREDIPVLAAALIRSCGSQFGRGEVALDDGAAAALGQYDWPGNVRELRNVIERAMLQSDRQVLTRADLTFDAGPTAAGSTTDLAPANLTLAELERWHIERVLREEAGHVARAAQRLGVPRSSLYQKIKQYKLASTLS
jgi:DNA-binding NtrC family response regulator